MDCLDCARDLQQQMGEGKMWDAFEKYYADDVVVVEGTGEKREGKEAQRAAIKQWQEMQQEMHGGGVNAITGDVANNVTCVESWVDVTFKDGHRWKMEEVAVQKWKDGQIIHERFYYDASPMVLAQMKAKEQG